MTNETTWHPLSGRSKALASKGVKLEFASQQDAEIGALILNDLESKLAVMEQALRGLIEEAEFLDLRVHSEFGVGPYNSNPIIEAAKALTPVPEDTK